MKRQIGFDLCPALKTLIVDNNYLWILIFGILSDKWQYLQNKINFEWNWKKRFLRKKFKQYISDMQPKKMLGRKSKEEIQRRKVVPVLYKAKFSLEYVIFKYSIILGFMYSIILGFMYSIIPGFMYSIILRVLKSVILNVLRGQRFTLSNGRGITWMN